MLFDVLRTKNVLLRFACNQKIRDGLLLYFFRFFRLPKKSCLPGTGFFPYKASPPQNKRPPGRLLGPFCKARIKKSTLYPKKQPNI